MRPPYGRGEKRPIIMNGMKKKLVLLILAGPMVVAALHPQTGAYAPFVSRLRTAVRGPEVKISWKDAADPAEGYVIYRHTREIREESFRDAERVARVAPGVEYYIDAPSRPGRYHYAVLAETGGKVFETFTPFQNTSSKAVPVLSTLPPAKLAAVVSRLRARADGDGIQVEFSADRADRELLTYRSTSPILTRERLGTLKPAARLKSSETRWTDYPVPGIPYYYAVLDAELGESGGAVLVPGSNATVEGAEIPLKNGLLSEITVPPRESPPLLGEVPPSQVSGDPRKTAAPPPVISAGPPAAPSPRPLPLPYLILTRKVSAEGDLPERPSFPSPRTIQPQAAEAAARAARRTWKPAPRPLGSQILEADRTPGPAREDYTLKTILDGPFREGKWAETEKLLDHYRVLNPSAEARARAGFYRAQTYFRQNRFRESFLEFLLVRDRFYPDVTPWLDEILLRLRLAADPS